MAFEAAQPLASGMLTGKYYRDMPDSEHPVGGRFDPSHFIGRHLRERYWFDSVFEAVEMIRTVAKTHGLTMRECSLRWLHHHSALRVELGDTVVFGASTPEQIEEIYVDVAKGPLPDKVVQVIDKSWSKAKLAS